MCIIICYEVLCHFKDLIKSFSAICLTIRYKSAYWLGKNCVKTDSSDPENDLINEGSSRLLSLLKNWIKTLKLGKTHQCDTKPKTSIQPKQFL